MSGVLIAPSILSADLGQLAKEVQEVDAAGADWIHVDVVDGHFAPHLTFGPGIAGAVRRATNKPVDVHLMIESPERFVEPFAEAGADHITVHGEACENLVETTRHIRALGKRAGVALRPETPVSSIADALDEVDIVLVLCVNPGRAGQAFQESQLTKMAELRELSERVQRESPLYIEVDGGIGPANAATVVRAGANVLVAGSKIFEAPDRGKAIREMRRAASVAPD